MHLPKEIFREYDIRGIAEKDLTKQNVEMIAKAYSFFMKKQNASKLIIGRDNRPSSKMFRDSVAKAFTESGFDVIDIGVVPTPVYYFAIHHFSAHGGIMVTASHLPQEYNGLKLSNGLLTLSGKEIQELRKLAENLNFVEGKGSVEEKNILNEYTENIVSQIKPEKKLKVVVDCGNGVTGLIAPDLFEKIGCDVTKLYCNLDSSFPNHHPDPVVEENVADLKKKVLEEKADLGIAFDADGDRIGAVDEKGRMVFGDILLALFSKQVLKQKPNSKILFEVKCSKALIDEIENLQGKPIMWKTGHSNIKKKMKQDSIPLAGEMSGHMFFADKYFGFDDGLYAGARLIELLSKQSQSFSVLVDNIPKYFSSPEIRIKSHDNNKFKIVEKAKQFFSEQFEIVDIDGLRINFPNGWGLIRASNTAPELVLRFEADSPENLEKIKKTVKEKLSAVDSSLNLKF